MSTSEASELSETVSAICATLTTVLESDAALEKGIKVELLAFDNRLSMKVFVGDSLHATSDD